MKGSLTIGIVGAGGDGVVALGGVLIRIAACQGYYASRGQYTEAQIRGGGSAIKICFSSEPILLPPDELDVLICFDWKKYLNFQEELTVSNKTKVFYEEEPPAEISSAGQFLKVLFSVKSRESTGFASNKNIVALGFLKELVGLSSQEADKIVQSEIKRLAGDLFEKNLIALRLGSDLFQDIGCQKLMLPHQDKPIPKIVLHGNEAVGWGAIKAGCRFAAAYPITPASEIMDYLGKELPKIGGVFVQGEDEIASMGMALGASLTGTKSIDLTSGPGFDLKTEMIGLASADEIPVVLVDVQRGGPSTGIPAKTEQSDLYQAIYGGHGDAPRVVLAPYNLEGCYRLTIEAFNIAEYFQVPIILLSDQWLGQTLMSTDRNFLEKEYQIIGRKEPQQNNKEDYKRYLITEDFISPMSHFGQEVFVYQTRGLSHNERGWPAENQKVSQLMHNKRWKKLLPLRERKDLVKIFGNPKAKIGIITWGSSGQAVLGAVKAAGLEKKVKICIPEIIYPLPEEILREFLKPIKKLLFVEMNYSGQFYHYAGSLIDLPKKTKVYKRVGGRPFSFQELNQAISGALR